MNITESAARHPWEPQPGTTAWELNEKLSELYKRVARLRGGLRCNFHELDLTLHKLQGEVLEEIVRTATESLFDEAELRALALIDECYALALELGAGAKPRADDFRKSMRLFVFQAARLRSGDPSTASWFWGEGPLTSLRPSPAVSERWLFTPGTRAAAVMEAAHETGQRIGRLNGGLHALADTLRPVMSEFEQIVRAAMVEHLLDQAGDRSTEGNAGPAAAAGRLGEGADHGSALCLGDRGAELFDPDQFAALESIERLVELCVGLVPAGPRRSRIESLGRRLAEIVVAAACEDGNQRYAKQTWGVSPGQRHSG